MYCVSDAKKTLEMELKAVEVQGVSISQLMATAGAALAEAVVNSLPEEGKPTIVFVCGKGSNAGDGFVAARILSEHKFNVTVLTLYEKSVLKGEALDAFNALNPSIVKDFNADSSAIDEAEVIVDCIFGFSFKPPLRDFEQRVISLINKQKALIVAADIPSGLEASTGDAEEGKVIIADKTVCFSCIKTGLLTNVGPRYAGKIEVAEIGINSDISASFALAKALSKADAASLVPKKDLLINKKSAGKVLAIAGSSSFTGAAILTAEAAFRAGAGFVTLAVPQAIKELIQQKATPELIIRGVSSTNDLLALAKEHDAIAIGPGLTTNKEIIALVRDFISKVDKPLVVDADALNAFNPSPLTPYLSPLILTPHAGELSRLIGLSVEDIEKDRLNVAQSFASKVNATVILKGRYSVIATTDETYVNLTSNPGMATAGTGDVLTGILASLAAQGLSTKEAALLGTYLHGLAGDFAAEELSQYSLMATDIIDCIGYGFKEIVSGHKP